MPCRVDHQCALCGQNAPGLPATSLVPALAQFEKRYADLKRHHHEMERKLEPAQSNMINLAHQVKEAHEALNTVKKERNELRSELKNRRATTLAAFTEADLIKELKRR